MTVDVKGSAPLWMKIKDLADGVTYNFRIRAKTLTYGPEVEANITTGPGEGKGWALCVGLLWCLTRCLLLGLSFSRGLFFTHLWPACG